MQPTFELVVEADYEYKIREGIKGGTEKGLRKIATEIARKTKLRMTALDAVDTGSMRASVYACGRGWSQYATAAANAQIRALTIGRHSGKPKLNFKMFPEEKPGPMEVIIAVGVSHGRHVEYGHNNVAGRASLGPAAAQVMAMAEVVIVEQINRNLTVI
jgi:hypothetical protein